MTNTGGTPPGWYQAEGDAAGTQRYWDGAQWVGEPQPIPQAPTAPAAQQAPTLPAAPAAPGFGSAPAYGAPNTGGVPGYGAPAGYVPFSHAAPVGAAAMVPAPIGKRLLAYLIDIAAFIVLFVIVVAAAAVFGDASAPFTVLALVVSLIYAVWNFWFRRGRTGQSIGDSNQGIKLVKNATGQPVGGWLAFARFFVIGLISNLTCGIAGVLDILWPLWDDRNNRLADKILSMTVVVA